ncbi:MAG: hypothetical protein JKY34_01000 [Kordiimonadaceae bacterium]|nr:hypothetical protein [Kordiimonadaceae bacterium]
MQKRFSIMSRRGFLLGTTATLVGAGLGLAAFVGSDAEYREQIKGERPETLSVREFAILEKFAETIVVPNGANVPSTRTARVARRIDRELVFHAGKLKSDIQQSLLYLEYSPPSKGAFSRFTSMNESQRITYIEALRNSTDVTERQIYAGLRFMCIFFYYTDERVWPSIGYDGPFVDAKPFAAGNSLQNLPPLEPQRNAEQAG